MDKKTRHWINAYVVRDSVEFELVCDSPQDCEENAPGEVLLRCAVKEWFDEVGVDLLLDFGDVRAEFGQVEVACRWSGDEEPVLNLVPPAN